MAKRQRRSRRKLPWPALGNPIECSNAEWSQTEVEAEQYRRMLKLKEHFGIEGETGWKPWYSLALVIASKFDEGLRITPYLERKGKTAPRWTGAFWEQLKAEVAAVRHYNPNESERWCAQQVFEQLPHRYDDLDFKDFYKRYTEKSTPK